MATFVIRTLSPGAVEKRLRGRDRRVKVSVQFDQVVIEGSVCVHCEYDAEQHLSDGKCPFDTTSFKQMSNGQFKDFVMDTINSGKMPSVAKPTYVPIQRTTTK